MFTRYRSLLDTSVFRIVNDCSRYHFRLYQDNLKCAVVPNILSGYKGVLCDLMNINIHELISKLAILSVKRSFMTALSCYTSLCSIVLFSNSKNRQFQKYTSYSAKFNEPSLVVSFRAQQCKNIHCLNLLPIPVVLTIAQNYYCVPI
jgi:hypothetical protein